MLLLYSNITTRYQNLEFTVFSDGVNNIRQYTRCDIIRVRIHGFGFGFFDHFNHISDITNEGTVGIALDTLLLQTPLYSLRSEPYPVECIPEPPYQHRGNQSNDGTC